MRRLIRLITISVIVMLPLMLLNHWLGWRYGKHQVENPLREAVYLCDGITLLGVADDDTLQTLCLEEVRVENEIL